ncbi:MAG TPA: hypothetical protein VKF84_13685 [Candidatus Sulfotelmatobacter sp.]|nr:hypothetical protein [Candidatus Sulfotelmatobacter sp.]
MLGTRYLRWLWATITLVALVVGAAASSDLSVEELKARLDSTGIGGRPHLCVLIAQKQLEEADKLYAADEVEKGQGALADAVTYAELARDYAIESHKYQKQSEIAVRAMTRKLTALLHSLGHDDQAPVEDAIRRLEKVRDDLLKAMFPKGVK